MYYSLKARTVTDKIGNNFPIKRGVRQGGPCSAFSLIVLWKKFLGC